MNKNYSKRLLDILDAYQASVSALSYIERHYNNADIASAFVEVKLADVRCALYQIEDVFYVRLFAEYQNIMKDHLRSNYPAITFDDEAKLDWLLSRIRAQEKFIINQKLRDRFDRARTYRNEIAHNAASTNAKVTIQEAAACLSTIVDKFS